MNKALSFVLLALVSGASTSMADPRFFPHWDTCDSYEVYKFFSGPGIYRQVITGREFEEPLTGYTIRLRLQAGNVYDGQPYVPLPDAWRFDPAGCQANRLSAVATGANCPSLASGAPVYEVTFEEYGFALDIVLSVRHDLFVPSPETMYSLWVLDYDHSHSAEGPQDPTQTCGGAEEMVCFIIQDAEWYDAQSNPREFDFAYFSGLSWQDDPSYGCFADLPVEPATWGAIKSLYR